MSKIYRIKNYKPPMQETQLVIVERPRGSSWLREDLASLRDRGIDVLASFLEPKEQCELGLMHEEAMTSEIGITYINFRIPDRQPPNSFMEAKAFTQDVKALLNTGQVVGLHCRQSVGRSGMMAAAILVDMGWSVGCAFDMIEQTRGCPVPDTAEQRLWVEKYARLPKIPLWEEWYNEFCVKLQAP